jgi:predicted methyltransferase
VLAACSAILACDDPARSAPRRASGLSAEDYDSWRQPERIVAALDLAPGQVVADVGAGRGYFTPRLAEAVGPAGRVTATDIDEHALGALAELARRTRGAPIEVRRVKAGDPGLEPGAYHRVLLAQVDHLLADRVDYLRRLRAALAPGGRVAISNRVQHRAGLLRALAAAGYAIERDVTDLPGQFVVVLAPRQTHEAHP